MTELNNHTKRDAGASARAEIRLFLGLLERRMNEAAKAHIASANIDEVAGVGTQIGREAASKAIAEISGVTHDELAALLGENAGKALTTGEDS